MGKRNVAKVAFALVVVSFLLSTTVSLVSLHIMSRRNVRDMNKVLATRVYDYISGELTGPIMVARTMSSNSFLVEKLAEEATISEEQMTQEMTNYLADIENGLGYQSAFVISQRSGKYYTRDGLNRIVHPNTDVQDEWYKRFASDRSQYDLDVDADEKNAEDLTVYVNAKINDENNAMVGVCGVGVRMTGIQELFHKTAYYQRTGAERRRM